MSGFLGSDTARVRGLHSGPACGCGDGAALPLRGVAVKQRVRDLAAVHLHDSLQREGGERVQQE
jgi:hypothetical protein